MSAMHPDYTSDERKALDEEIAFRTADIAKKKAHTDVMREQIALLEPLIPYAEAKARAIAAGHKWPEGGFDIDMPDPANPITADSPWPDEVFDA